jgi:molybdopterin/thiamine biosynthesis adenylyltransferase
VSERRAFFRELGAAAREAARAATPSPPAASPAEPPSAEAAPEEVVLPEEDPERLSDAELERYSRQLVLPEWSEAAQLALRRASVAVVGAGALGAPVATYLAAAGVGRIGLVDDDAVELSNLARQFLHYTPDLGVPKAESAAAKLRFLNPEVVVEPYRVRLAAGNAAGLVAGHDLVVDCSDAFATRYAVNAACCAAGVPLVEGGVVGTSGLVMAVRPQESACYRCAFPEAPPPGAAPTCAEAGVLGPAAGVVGSLQALQALELLTGVGEPLLNAFLQLDLATMDILRVTVRRRPDCPDCGGRTL